MRLCPSPKNGIMRGLGVCKCYNPQATQGLCTREVKVSYRKVMSSNTCYQSQLAVKSSKKSSCQDTGWNSTVKDLITIQHKIIILGVTTAYYLSFLNFQTCFDAYFYIKTCLFASVCFSKCVRLAQRSEGPLSSFFILLKFSIFWSFSKTLGIKKCI